MGILMEKTDFGSVKNCLKLSNGTVALIVTLGFGPRILFYGFIGDINLFKTFDDQLSSPGGNEWKSYGGHRLWHAPEIVPRTYYPDNDEVPYTWDGSVLTLNPPDEKTNGIGKRITVALAPSGTGVTLNHTLINRNAWTIELSAWCLSVMAGGGRAVIPQEEYRPHPECLIPARPLVLWHFTTMNDPRFAWGERYIVLAQDDDIKSKQKIGVANTKGWAAYCLSDVAFVKRHEYLPGALYPDMGCSAEFYTEPGFLEMESLSPMTRIAPGKDFSHEERWSLHKMKIGEGEKELDRIAALV